MTGKYLSLIKEYARLKTVAVIPEPHENTILFSFLIPICKNFSLIRFFSKNVLLFRLISSSKGKQCESWIEPLFKPGLGSFSSPKNLFLLLASTTLNFFSNIFLFISSFVLTRFAIFFAL